MNTNSMLPEKPMPLDRKALVSRHNVARTSSRPRSPLQVGNGHFAFGADITGLQTFIAFNTMSDWGWYEFDPPAGTSPSDFQPQMLASHGREVPYRIDDPAHPEINQWLFLNPYRINLGRIGLRLLKENGEEAGEADLTETAQELNLWTGVLTSRFRLEGHDVVVVTACDPESDCVSFTITSPLIAADRLQAYIDFPFADPAEFADYVGDWTRPEAHRTSCQADEQQANFQHDLGKTVYFARLSWNSGASFRGRLSEATHRYFLHGASSASSLEFSCTFSSSPLSVDAPAISASRVIAASEAFWPGYWRSGAAIDLSSSSDPRWREMERRCILSQYLMRVNAAGAMPPQESGLVNNGWSGKFHMEMYLWHAAHFALWNHWPEINRSLGIYDLFLESSRQRAQEQGFKGVRWPKMTCPEGRETPNLINPLLIWQQPHPMFFAELDYRAHPAQDTLEKWREVLFETADFMASFAYRSSASGEYELGPPVYLVSENTVPFITKNPTFELSQWRFGLNIAQQWRTRLGLEPDPQWEDVLRHLAPLPIQDGVYVTFEGIEEMWTKYNYEHPGLSGVYGLLPGNGVDMEVMQATAERVFAEWRLDGTWGWDFPMQAMCAARLGKTAQAVDFLLAPVSRFEFDDAGLATGGPFPYFPSNGAFLYAIALMAGGWDDAPERLAPGFPDDGSWTVRSEGLQRAL